MNELVKSSPSEVNDENFSSIFHDVRKRGKPEPGEVLASWRSSADFVDGWVKRQVIELLATNKAGAATARTVMNNVVSAVERDSIRVCLDIATDLMSSVEPQEILDKPYPFVIEIFYWVKPEYVPDDIHWTVIKTLDLTDVANRLNISEEELLTEPAD